MVDEQGRVDILRAEVLDPGCCEWVWYCAPKHVRHGSAT